MHKVLCFAAENVPRKMDGEGCRAAWRVQCARRVRLGADHAAAQSPPHSKRRLANLKLSVFDGSFLRSLFSHLELSLFEGRLTRKVRFEGNLARKLRFHIFHFHFLREAHESLVGTSSTFTF